MVLGRKSWCVFTMICVLSLLTACGSKDGNNQKIGDTNVYLGGEVIEKDEQIIVEGKSNLIEGARVTGQVFVNGDELFSDTTELVDKKGNFKMEMEHPIYGEAEVVVLFDFKNLQDEPIIEQYGEGGMNLEGPYTYIVDHWDVKTIEKKAEVSLLLLEDDVTTHTFQKPDWDERAEDYGDPRVWLEVDDITDDGENFYISGKSNLLEGSLIRASHRHSGETRVHPDGTFDFKIEYSYEEGKPVIITFSPFSQWASIEEHYGKNGEKLVGNLVKKDGNYLNIEYAVEYE